MTLEKEYSENSAVLKKRHLKQGYIQSRLDHAIKTTEVLQKVSSREHRKGKDEQAKQRHELQQRDEIIDILFGGKNIVCPHCHVKD